MIHSNHGIAETQQAPVIETAKGPLRCLRILGRGGMGEVFLGDWDGRPVAVKRLRRSLLQNQRQPEKFVERFRREAMAGMRVSHPSLVPIYELIEHKGELLIVMEYVDGLTLRSSMNDELSFTRAMRWAGDIAEGLEALHRSKIVHRDLKPDNILIDRLHGRARLTDYSIARVQDADTLTSSPRVLGTPGYMAPEQARGQRVDARADLFSLGVLLYELVSGCHPFAADDLMQAAHKLMEFPHRPLNKLVSQVPSALSLLVDQLLEKQPEKRPSDVHQIFVTLRRIQLASYRFNVGQPDADKCFISHPFKTVVIRRPQR